MSIFEESKSKIVCIDVPTATSILVVLSSLLLISDISLSSLVLIVLITSIQTHFGVAILRRIPRTGIHFHPSELLVGFLIGTSSHIVIDQLMRSSGYRYWVLPSMLAISLILNWNFYKNFQEKRQKLLKDLENMKVHYSTFLLVILPLCQVWSWTRNIVAVLLGAFVVVSILGKWIKPWIIYIFVVLGLVGVSRIRPLNWWLPGWGIDEHKIFSVAIFTWGPNGDVLLADIPLKYQWFGYAWMGAMSDVTKSQDFEFVSRSAYVICSVAIVFAVYAISLEILRNSRKAGISTLIIVGASTAISYPVAYSLLSINYLPIATLLLLGWILLLLKWIQLPSFANSVLISLMSVICVSVKSVHLIAVVLIPALVAVQFLWKRDTRYLGGAVVGIFLCYIYTLFFFPSRSGTGLINFFANFTRQFGVTPEVSSNTARIFMVVTYFLAIVVVPMALLICSKTINTLVTLKMAFFCYFLVASYFAVFYKRVSATELHFLQIFVLIALVIFVPATVHSLEIYARKRSVLIFSAIVSCLLVLPFLMPFRILNDDLKFVLTILRLNAFFGFVYVFFAAVFFKNVFQFFGGSSRLRVPVAISMVALFASNFLFISITRDIRPINRVAVNSQLGDFNLQEAAKWINENTNLDDIVASNLFFGEESADYCSPSDENLLSSVVDLARKSNYYTTAALIERRFLAAGVLYASITYNGDLTSRLSASLRPACFPDQLSLTMLQENSVDIYLAYRNQSLSVIDWNDLGEVVFRNSQFVIIDVRTK